MLLRVLLGRVYVLRREELELEPVPTLVSVRLPTTLLEELYVPVEVPRRADWLTLPSPERRVPTLVPILRSPLVA